MDERDLVAFLFRTILQEEFGTMTSMSEMLNVPFRTVQWVFQHLETEKGATTAFQQLICYCCEQDIDISDLFERFRSNRREEGEPFMGVKRVRVESGDENFNPQECGTEDVYEVFDSLVQSVCAQCPYANAIDLHTECALTKVADTLAERRLHTHATKEGEEMKRMDLPDKIGIIRWILVEAFNEYFGGSHANMATALHLPEADIEKALVTGQWRPSAAVFERLAAYCLQHKLSLDALLSRYGK